MKKIILLGLISFLLCSSHLQAQTDNLRITPVVDAVQKVSPAVVNISTEEIIRSNPFRSYDPFMDEFFGNFFDAQPPQRSRQSLGSGIIIHPSGYVITNEHVVARATNVIVTLSDNRSFTARVVAADPDFDVAVLKLQTGERLPSLVFGTSSDLMPGETVIAIGNPFGLSHTVTTGVVSAIRHSIKTEKRMYEDFIQTDAAINPGNSGGPLINIKGELIGVNTAIYGEGQGIGFAIPIDKVHRIVEDLLVYGEVRPAYLGIRVQGLTAALKKSLGYGGEGGVLVSHIDEGGPAEGKLVPGDILVEMNNKVIESQRQFAVLNSGLVTGEKIQFKIHRSGEVIMVSLVTAEYPLQLVPKLCGELLGIELKYDSSGVMVDRVNPSGPAGTIGIKPGDMIFQIGDREVKTIKQFNEALIRYRNGISIFMVVGRGRYAYRVVVPLE